MKKYIFTAAIAALCFIACSTEEPTSNMTARITADTTDMKPVTITFRCHGFDISSQPFEGTRAELKADGKVMTDLWVLDYIDGSLAQSVIHQTASDEDFGTQTLNLAVGSHHVYFIASRGKTATLDTYGHTITFGTVSDTFYYDLSLNVTATSSGSRSVTLERIVTKFTAVITDAIPEGAATFNITPSEWYYGWDYVAGTPTTATASQTITINIPSSEIGVTNEPLNIYGFSAADEWATDVSIDCRKSDNTILGTATIDNVPLDRNRITTFSGPLFSANGLTTVSLSSDWLDEHTGTW